MTRVSDLFKSPLNRRRKKKNSGGGGQGSNKDDNDKTFYEEELEEGEKQLYVATLEGCPHCETFKEHFKEPIEKGAIKEKFCSEKDGDGKENLKAMVKNDINAFPTLFEVTKLGDGEFKLCEVDLKSGKYDNCRKAK